MPSFKYTNLNFDQIKGSIKDYLRSNSEFADFYDEKKSTLISISKIASLSKATVIPCINHFCKSRNKYITYVDKPLASFPSNSSRVDALIINKSLEKLISRDLNQYMWSLRLFQTRPDGKKFPYAR